MDFSEYLNKYNMSQIDASERFGLSLTVIKKALKKENIGIETIRKIVGITREEVSANELIGFPRRISKGFWRRRKK